jgi:hypothetical protein
LTEIRPFRIAEAPVLKAFLRDHWQAKHALVHSPTLLTWQHASPFRREWYAADELSFVGAWHDNELMVILGEIPVPLTVRGARAKGSWLAVWKNRSTQDHAGLGLSVFERLCRRPDFVCGIGINAAVVPAYKLLRFRLADDVPLQLVVNPERSGRLVQRKSTWNASRADRFFPRAPAPSAQVVHQPVSRAVWEPFWERQRTRLIGVDRTFEYIQWRYLDHPHYRYDWLQILDQGGRVAAVAVYRVEHVLEVDETVIQAVELLGDEDARPLAAAALCDELRRRGASLLNFRCPHRATLESWRTAGGGIYAKDDPDLEVASLYQPVVNAYRPLVWGYRTSSALPELQRDDLYITRSDSDQDRPSRLID